MTIVTIAVVGIIAVLLAVQLKSVKAEYAVYLGLCAAVVIFFYGISKLETIMETVKKFQEYIKINNVYLATLMKMIGITYVAEFSSGICKDAGYSSIGNQIEIFGKLSILAISMPILLALMETLQVFLI